MVDCLWGGFYGGCLKEVCGGGDCVRFCWVDCVLGDVVGLVYVVGFLSVEYFGLVVVEFVDEFFDFDNWFDFFVYVGFEEVV